ncbi:NUDIX domain-containing protein [Actinomyces mediterranea]|uniref:NUDIX domain-containing protein n=1 Tax=Actinomyces mediterranea TaxID=1871028 RepID=UPI000970FCE2|nr:NUDIX hydrolase [Actinomyces mediterranea]
MSLTEVPADERRCLADRKAERELVEHRHLWQGRVMGLEEDLVRVVDGCEPVVRQYTSHPGAVAVVVMRGQAGSEEILLLRQYRHPVSAELWEIPAGLLDIDGEDPRDAAIRELAEEADLVAHRWDLLVDFFCSPGGTTESLRIFLARDLVEAGVSFERLEEEADMVCAWVGLDEAVAMILDGRLHNPSAVTGILAAHAARAKGWEGLRAVDASWLR